MEQEKESAGGRVLFNAFFPSGAASGPEALIKEKGGENTQTGQRLCTAVMNYTV